MEQARVSMGTEQHPEIASTRRRCHGAVFSPVVPGGTAPLHPMPHLVATPCDGWGVAISDQAIGGVVHDHQLRQSGARPSRTVNPGATRLGAPLNVPFALIVPPCSRPIKDKPQWASRVLGGLLDTSAYTMCGRGGRMLRRGRTRGWRKGQGELFPSWSPPQCSEEASRPSPMPPISSRSA